MRQASYKQRFVQRQATRPIVPFVVARGQDRLQHFAGDHWAVRLAALLIETLPPVVRAAGLFALGMAAVLWKLLP